MKKCGRIEIETADDVINDQWVTMKRAVCTCGQKSRWRYVLAEALAELRDHEVQGLMLL